ncbi:rod-binding protein [Candidatus Desantisbacteria bacterium]|nr:rod-binding protein [Candidatus Desantisbacteria bacterium]
MNPISSISGMDSSFNRILNYQTKKNEAASQVTAGETGILSPKVLSPEREKELKLQKERLQEASYDLEAIFVNMLLKEMRKSVEKTELFHGGYAEDMWNDMLYDEYAKSMAKSNKLGMASMIYNQMEKYL